MPSNPSLGWERLSNVFYRSRDCFELKWDDDVTDISDAIVAVSPYAAQIAIYKQHGSGEAGRAIQVYSGSGVLLSTLPWLQSIGHIVALSWTDDCQLLVVMESGKWRLYYNLDGDFDERSLSTDASVVDVRFDGSKQFAARLSNNGFVCPDVKPIEGQIHGWTVMPGSLLVSVDSSILRVTADEVSTAYVGNGPYELVAASPNHELIALYSGTEVTIVTANFKHTLNVLKSDKGALQMEWCSNDAVIVSYKDELKLVGPSKDTINFYLDSPALIRSEQDGLYYLNSEKLGFISKVSSVTQDTFRIGSTSPNAILLDTIDLLDSHSPKANKNIEIIDGSLIAAVDGCIRAAAEEFEPYWQKKLMRAAAFGKINIQMYNPTEFVETADWLRVLNIVRQPEVGIFLTYTQLTTMGVDKLIDLLLLRRQHLLCLKLAAFLDVPADRIYLDWAECKIKNAGNVSDGDLASLIIKRLQNKQTSFASIAEVAYQEGRQELSVKLLNRETETARSIPLLLEMEQDDYALQKCEDDIDVDSLLFVLVTLFNKDSRLDFFKSMDGKPNAAGVFRYNLMNLDPELAYDYYYQDDYIPGLATLQLNDFLKAVAGGATLEAKRMLLNKTSKLLGRSKSTEYESKRLKAEARIVDQMDSAQVETNSYEPVMTTIGKLCLEDLTRATKLARDCKIPDSQVYWKVLKTLAPVPEKRSELYSFATARKSPIGYEPFFTELYRLGDKRQAGIYVKLCTGMSYQARVKCYLDCDDYKSAIEEAAKKKDRDLLDSIKSITTNAAYSRMIDDALESITGSRRFG